MPIISWHIHGEGAVINSLVGPVLGPNKINVAKKNSIAISGIIFLPDRGWLEPSVQFHWERRKSRLRGQ